jgi:hypothetical protein
LPAHHIVISGGGVMVKTKTIKELKEDLNFISERIGDDAEVKIRIVIDAEKSNRYREICYADYASLTFLKDGKPEMEVDIRTDP